MGIFTENLSFFSTTLTRTIGNHYITGNLTIDGTISNNNLNTLFSEKIDKINNPTAT